jgi:hypothetical protein
MAEMVKSVGKPVRKLTVYKRKDGKTEKEVIVLKRNDVVIACANYVLYGDVIDGDTDRCVVAFHDHVNTYDYEDVTELLGLDSEYSADAYGVHIKHENGEIIEVIGDIITYRDKRGNKFTYRRMHGLNDFLIID